MPGVNIRNYVVFDEDGGELTFKIREDQERRRTITDPETSKPKQIVTHELILEEANGAPSSAILSVSSDKLYAQLRPHLERRDYKGKTFRLTATGAGRAREYSLSVVA